MIWLFFLFKKDEIGAYSVDGVIQWLWCGGGGDGGDGDDGASVGREISK